MSDSSTVNVGPLPPTFDQYEGKESFFGGKPPLSEGIGYLVVLGFGLSFSIITTIFVLLHKYFGNVHQITSEHFTTAGRSIKTGLTAAVIVAQWTWAATLLQSSNVAWKYGVSGPFWYASGATIQVILFGVLAVSIKKVAPSAHTVCEIVRARWGRGAHKTFLFFCFCANTIVTSMLLLGGAATVEALTGMDYRLASFLIPWGVIIYTATGGLQAAFLASYFQTLTIYVVLIIMIFLVYIKIYSTDEIYELLDNTVSKTPEQCAAIFSNEDGSFWVPQKYSCGRVPGNKDGSYLTMISADGLMFGIINIIGNFGTVFVDQSYWQSAIAARPASASRGYMLGGLCWFAIPFSLATSVGLASTALMLPITSNEAGAGLVPPAVATELMGKAGAVLILIMLFMAIVSTGAAESIAVSSLISYDIYREYINPDATGEQILYVSRSVIICFGLFMGCFSIALYEIGLDLGWVYLFMGIMIGSAVFPLWNMMTWEKASGTGAVVATWMGLVLALIGWTCGAKVQSGEVTVAALGTNEVMLSGNLIAILSSGFIHWFWSTYIDPQDFDFTELNKRITLVVQDTHGLTAEDLDPVLIRKSEQWIKRRGYAMTLILCVIWPVLSVPIGVFTERYFAFWVLVAIGWGFGAALILAVLPLSESSDTISLVFNGMWEKAFGKPLFNDDDEVPADAIVDESRDGKKDSSGSMSDEKDDKEPREKVDVEA